MSTKIKTLAQRKSKEIDASSFPATWCIDKKNAEWSKQGIKYFTMDLRMCQLKKLKGLCEEPFDMNEFMEGNSPNKLTFDNTGVGSAADSKLSGDAPKSPPLSPSSKLQWKCLCLDASINRIENITVLDNFTFPDLRELNLSTNHFNRIPVITKKNEIRVLTLSNNAIADFVGLKSFSSLQYLDLSINKLRNLDGLSVCKSLKSLNVSKNELISLNDLEKLEGLTSLNISYNRVRSINILTTLVNLSSLNMMSNQIENLEMTATALMCMTKLEVLTMSDNPIASKKDYKMHMLRNANIKTIDGVNVKPYVRQQLRNISMHTTAEELVQETTHAYISLIELEQNKLSQNVELLRTKEKIMQEYFADFKDKMEREMEECVSFILKLKEAKTDLDLVFSLKGLSEFKSLVIAEELKRKQQEIDLAEEKAQKLQRRIADASKAVSFTEKLYYLSKERPDLWRQMKEKEAIAKRLEDEMSAKQIMNEENERNAKKEKEEEELKSKARKNLINENIQSVSKAEKHNGKMSKGLSQTQAAMLIQKRFRAHRRNRKGKRKKEGTAALPLSRGGSVVSEPDGGTSMIIPPPVTTGENKKGKSIFGFNLKKK